MPPTNELNPDTWSGSFREAMHAVNLTIAKHDGRFDVIEQQQKVTQAVVAETRGDIKDLTASINSVLLVNATNAQEHKTAAEDRARLWTFVKAQWAATGVASMVAALIGRFS